MLKVGDIVKVISKTDYLGKKAEIIPIGTICKVSSVYSECDGSHFYDIKNMNPPYDQFFYLESELEKVGIEWKPEKSTTKKSPEQKLRVWWIPQIPMDTPFYIPVKSPEEAKKVMDILAFYDMFQYENKIKPDYCNVGGLEMFDEETGEWIDWFYETESTYYDNIDEYCEEKDKDGELEQFCKYLSKQVV